MKKVYKDEQYPTYEITVNPDDNTGFNLISFVADPAIEMMALCFNKEGIVKEYEFKAVADKQILVGPALIPDKKIKRKDADGNKYFVVFKPDTIKLMVEKFNKTGQTRKFNVDHSNKMVNAYLLESWFVEDAYYDKSRMYGFDVPVGTWMISVKVDDQEFWQNEVKDLGKFGFSVEGLMGEKPLEFSDQKDISDWIKLLSEDDWIKIDPRFKRFLTELNFDSDEVQLPPCHDHCKCEIDADGVWNFSDEPFADGSGYSPCDYCRERKADYDARKEAFE